MIDAAAGRRAMTLEDRMTYVDVKLSHLISTHDRDGFLRSLVELCASAVEAERCTFYLVDHDRAELRARIAQRAGVEIVLPLGTGLAGHCAASGETINVPDAYRDSRFDPSTDRRSGYRTENMLVVPVWGVSEPKRVYGVIQVLNKREGGYGEGHIGLLSSLANLASVAIVNAKIMGEQKNFFSHVLELLTASIETSRPGLEDYPVRAAKLACEIGRALEVDEHDYRMLYYAGVLHKIGYVAFKSPRLLADLGVTSASEEMLPAFSARMLEGIKMLDGAIPMIRHHKERFDGSGYPGKLAGEAIPFGARILGLVTKMEELRSAGLRGEALGAQALKEARAGEGTSYDPKVVEAFAAVLESRGGAW
ncbi:MAG: GAF domain-containing protein [Elusimicrobiota bacterium]|nr:GAF domain-containing protein [Elusimicrobiota bacterium]